MYKAFVVRHANDPHEYPYVVVKHSDWDGAGFDILASFDEDDEFMADAYIKENYPPISSPPCARLGFIAPDGIFYPCAYSSHSDLENILMKHFYDSSWGELKKYGWIELHGGAHIGVSDNTQFVSEAAKATLLKIVEAFEDAELMNPEINWCQVLLENPEKYDTQFWSTPPDDCLYKNKTYAENLRGSYELYFGDRYRDVGLLITPNETLSKRPKDHPGD